MVKSIAVVGMQWGDEGKGKVIDLLSEEASHIARAQGGNNAGHTIVAKGREYKFHLIPSGILYPHAKCYVGGGTVLDPPSLIKEMEQLDKQGIDWKKRLFLSLYAQIVFPYHQLLDQLSEKRKGRSSIGTTGKGIGPCYSDKINRCGLRLVDLLSPRFKEKLSDALDQKNWEIASLYGHAPLDLNAIFDEYSQYANELKAFAAPVEELLFQASARNEKILFEGAQGTLLDVTFGTYPYVTSSCTLSGGFSAGLGFGPTRVGKTIGVVKAYTTRVGNGPFPTELSEQEMRAFPDHTTSREVGTTTGRKRRMGWFDAFMIRHTQCLNAVDSLAIMKLDILDALDEIKICTGYKKCKFFPADSEDLSLAVPIYESHPGWKEPTSDIRVYDDLPSKAKAYLRRLEELCEVPIGLVSVGPDRERTIWLDQYFSNE